MTYQLSKALCELNEKIHMKFFPNIPMDASPNPYDFNAHLWLEEEIVTILSDTSNDFDEVFSQIHNILSSSEFGKEILTSYISLSELKEEGLIRRDYDTALSQVEKGSKLSSKLRWTFGPDDLKQLALLHKDGKHQQKIEDLLEDCNFHEECDLFHEHNYDEFLPTSPVLSR